MKSLIRIGPRHSGPSQRTASYGHQLACSELWPAVRTLGVGRDLDLENGGKTMSFRGTQAGTINWSEGNQGDEVSQGGMLANRHFRQRGPCRRKVWGQLFLTSNADIGAGTSRMAEAIIDAPLSRGRHSFVRASAGHVLEGLSDHGRRRSEFRGRV